MQEANVFCLRIVNDGYKQHYLEGNLTTLSKIKVVGTLGPRTSLATGFSLGYSTGHEIFFCVTGFKSYQKGATYSIIIMPLLSQWVLLPRQVGTVAFLVQHRLL